MGKQIFKKGDRVFMHLFGWGVITDTNVHGHPKIYHVYFDNDDELELKEYELSFTEYTLQNFTQERPINYADYIGKWGKFWDNDGTDDFRVRLLKEVDGFLFIDKNEDAWGNFKPLTEEQIKILEL